jgi:hypothetical protein
MVSVAFYFGARKKVGCIISIHFICFWPKIVSVTGLLQGERGRGFQTVDVGGRRGGMRD